MKRFLKDRRGNFALTTALMTLPVMAASGLAVDYVNLTSNHKQLQNAADAAVFAVYTTTRTDQKLAETTAQNFVRQSMDNALRPELVKVKVELEASAIRVAVQAAMPTSIMRVVGIDTVDYNVMAEINFGAGNAEIAMVLDNTGSMEPYMGELRDAAISFVDAVMPGGGSNSGVQIALIPYVGAVNIGNGPKQKQWVDKTGASEYHGDAIEHGGVGKVENCTPVSTGGGGGGGNNGGGNTWNPDNGDGVSLPPAVDRFFAPLRELFGVSPAYAHHKSNPSANHNENNVASDYVEDANANVNNCWVWSKPPVVSHLDLFDSVGITWAGCVEARPEPYDISDDPPTSTNANTLFVPYFWPDDSDKFEDWVPTGHNDWMRDAPFPTVQGGKKTDFEDRNWERTWNHRKYSWIKGKNAQNERFARHNETTSPSTVGPNKSCGAPIQDLTNDKTKIVSAINAMEHRYGSGTVMSEGLAWGWRVLSPGEPFTSGAKYGDVRKILVMMTDGENDISTAAMNVKSDGSLDPWTSPYLTHYNAYGVLRDNRRLEDDEDKQAFIDYIDDRTATVCENIKDKDIELYVIGFGDLNAKTKKLLEECASAPPNYVHITSSTQLKSAFAEIANQISGLRLTR